MLQEYIISRRLFEGLPPDEKKYWHSHQYEVRHPSSCQPGLEHASMCKRSRVPCGCTSSCRM